MAIAFDNSYARLPAHFFAAVRPLESPAPRLIAVNDALAGELGIDADWLGGPAGLDMLSGRAIADGATPIGSFGFMMTTSTPLVMRVWTSAFWRTVSPFASSSSMRAPIASASACPPSTSVFHQSLPLIPRWLQPMTRPSPVALASASA